MKVFFNSFLAAFLIVLVFGGLVCFSGLESSSSPLGTTITWTDDFNQLTLNDRWEWIFEVPSHWSLTAHPGYLRIITRKNFELNDNMLVQAVPEGDFSVQTRVLFYPTETFQFAGLLVFDDHPNYLRLGRGYCHPSPPDCVGNGIYFELVENYQLVGSLYATTVDDLEQAHLKILREGDQYTGYVSNDGQNWSEVGAHTVSPSFTPERIGLFASNGHQENTEINADFDYFTLSLTEPDSWLLFVPMWLR